MSDDVLVRCRCGAEWVVHCSEQAAVPAAVIGRMSPYDTCPTCRTKPWPAAPAPVSIPDDTVEIPPQVLELDDVATDDESTARQRPAPRGDDP